jgi:hypothetical protein
MWAEDSVGKQCRNNANRGHCCSNANREHCWEILLQQCEPRSSLEHTVATMTSDKITANNDLGNYCCLWHHCCICYSLGCPNDVIARDMAWRFQPCNSLKWFLHGRKSSIWLGAWQLFNLAISRVRNIHASSGLLAESSRSSSWIQFYILLLSICCLVTIEYCFAMRFRPRLNRNGSLRFNIVPKNVGHIQRRPFGDAGPGANQPMRALNISVTFLVTMLCLSITVQSCERSFLTLGIIMTYL